MSAAAVQDRAGADTAHAWPRGPHVPGTGSRPDRDRLDQITATVPAGALAPECLVAQPAFHWGRRFHGAGFHWEAHEVWEAVWMACPPNGRERRLLRCLIQTTNAGLKLRMGRPRAALRLVREALDLALDLARGPAVLGLDARALAQGLSAYHRAIADGQTPEPPDIAL